MEVLGLLFCSSRNQYSWDNKKIYKINTYREKGTETERICNALESDSHLSLLERLRLRIYLWKYQEDLTLFCGEKLLLIIQSVISFIYKANFHAVIFAFFFFIFLCKAKIILLSYLSGSRPSIAGMELVGRLLWGLNYTKISTPNFFIPVHYIIFKCTSVWMYAL